MLVRHGNNGFCADTGALPWFVEQIRRFSVRSRSRKCRRHRGSLAESGGWSGRVEVGVFCPGPPLCLPARGISRTSRRPGSQVAVRLRANAPAGRPRPARPGWAGAR
jgi:hypothetical protein